MPPRRRRVRRARRAVLTAMPLFASPTAPVRKRAVRRRRRRAVVGGNIFRRIWSGLRSGFNYARRHQLISRGLALVPHPTAQKAAAVARVAGLGRRTPSSNLGGAARGGSMRLGNHVLVY